MAETGNLRGRITLVTGATSGIGHAAALRLSEAGAHVVAVARNSERGEALMNGITANGGTAEFVRCDVSQKGEVAQLVTGIASRHGRLDIAVNGAGSESRRRGLIGDSDEADFEHAITQNLRSAWLCMKYELTQMTAQRPSGGAIVNISSVNALGGAPRAAATSAAKAGVVALTKAAALEYASHGVRVNVVVPGAIDTPMLDRVLRQVSEGNAETERHLRRSLIETIPMRRLGRPEDIAEVILWLASDAAGYVTGHALVADGGVTAGRG